MPLVAEYLLNREAEVIQWFRTEHQWFKTQLENETSNTGIRMFKRYATITTSARILERVIATPIDLDAVRDYLINYHLDSVSERDRLPKLSKLSPNLWHRIEENSRKTINSQI